MKHLIKSPQFKKHLINLELHDPNRFAIGVLDVRNLNGLETMIFDNDPLLIGCVDLVNQCLQLCPFANGSYVRP